MNFHGIPWGPVIMVLGLAALVVGMMVWSFFSYHHQLKHYEEPSESKHEEKQPICRQNARVLEKKWSWCRPEPVKRHLIIWSVPFLFCWRTEKPGVSRCRG